MPNAVIAVVESEPRKAEDWYAHVLLQALERRRPLRTLVISSRPDELAGAGISATCSVRFGNGHDPRWQAVACRAGTLPFQVDVFELVVLHACIEQNDERTLATVRRSMPGGSELLVMGRARMSPGRLRRGAREERSFRPGWLVRRLRRMSFVTKDMRGRGIGGIDAVTGRGWRRYLLSCSDRVAIRARRSEARHDIRLVRFSSPKPVVGRGAAWDSVNRDYPP